MSSLIPKSLRVWALFYALGDKLFISAVSHSLFFLSCTELISSTDNRYILLQINRTVQEYSLHGTHNNKQTSFLSFAFLSFRKPSKVISKCPMPITMPLLSKPSTWDKAWHENIMRCKTTKFTGDTMRRTGIKNIAGTKNRFWNKQSHQ